MSDNLVAIMYLISALLFILALRGLSHPESSRLGNIFGIVGMIIAIITTLMFKSVLSYFEIEIPSSNDDLDIPEELQNQVLGDDRFICLSEKLELSDVLEFLYTGTLSDSVLNSANECDISKEEIEDLDISELLN